MNQPLFYFTKILDISLIGMYYITLGVLCSIIINKIFSYKNNKKKDDVLKKKKTILIIFEILLQAATIMVAAYLSRKVVKNIPYPLHGFNGYDHYRLKEINGGVLIAFSLIVLLSDFKNKIIYVVSDRLNLL